MLIFMKEKKFKAIRKSAFMVYKQCPKRFEYNYADPKYWDYGTTTDKSNMKTWRGNEFHEGVEHFFDNLIGETITKELPELFRNHLPQHEDTVVNGWFDWFSDIELKRYQTEDMKYFLPIANELKVYYENTIDRTGHIDRIDRLNETNICSVEYKAGQSYDMTIPDRTTSMNSEIGFYVQILKLSKEYPDYKITHWKVINPVHKKVWMNKISPISLRSVETVFADMVDKIIKKKVFPKKISPLCHWCPYMKPCDPFYGKPLGIDFNKPL